MVQNEVITGTVEKLVYGGDGLLRVDGYVVFVPRCATGETVEARVVQVKKNFAKAELIRVVGEPSADRVADDPTSETPGCVYAHLSEEAELREKEEQLRQFLRHLSVPKVGKDDKRLPHPPYPILPSVAAPSGVNYRNKITLRADVVDGETKPILGYMEEGTHTVVDMPTCPLACPAINDALAEFRKTEAFAQLRKGEQVAFRATAEDGVTILKYAPVKGYRKPGRPLIWDEETKQFVKMDELPWLWESIGESGFLVPADGFFQVNPAMGWKLVQTVTDWFGEDAERYPEILDLYCGVGVFGIACMRCGGERLYGVEESLSSVEAARENAKHWCGNSHFTCVSLGGARRLRSNWLHDPSRTTVIVDPPRGGLSANTVESLVAARPPRIFYVSCDPATLARDLQLFIDGGYRIRRTQLFNLFPRTARFETVVELRSHRWKLS
ncbi:MAG: class I SAM-dependent RNA methyltransferase [Kiritimatiellae bacterium]|nr:class I SAM-dependent RNA methyltransferase [Kiritimatiellia bacterium]